MKKLKILSCRDSLLWYYPLIGSTVPYVRSILSEGVYMSRDQGNYLNIVYMRDAELIEE